ncbi:Gfo/Idh/MocA family oxidoreductase [Pedobacter polaris]|uniref:Gfo/Idh/MocA family oxidoreductase n=1 Tax=Pedobacter polaris TaxID=2571273 RepID=A0A4U1CMU4_9SPHI|nr:Gfo/Idh/MocA family oxidoreductase [Pedobacter polaris]TKC06643.1 Gfo/Idh/MocA family oxidoreductase [Pedobacter polaris]
MKIYRLGIIGYGGFGRFLHQWWGKLENIQVMAIADSKAECDEVDGCRIYRHWEELLLDADIDIVSIVTPPSVHAEIAVAAMRAGKHVMLEKPVAVSLVQVRDILHAKRETGMSIMVNHMLRYTPVMKEMVAIAKSGCLGELRHAQVANYAQDGSLPVDHWFWNRDLSGGILVEHGVHFFDLINSLTTQGSDVISGESSWRNSQQQDRVSATVGYDRGLIAQHYHAFSGPGFFEQTTIRLAFDLARIEIRGWIPMSGTVSALTCEKSRDALARLPGWKAGDSGPIPGGRDTFSGELNGQELQVSVYVSGIQYFPDQDVTGSFSTPGTKAEIYGGCVQEILGELISCIEDPGYRPRVSIEDAVAALETALAASG